MVLTVGEEFIPSKGMGGHRLMDKEDMEDDDEESVEDEDEEGVEDEEDENGESFEGEGERLQGRRMSRKSIR